MNQKGFANIAIVILALIAVSALGYFALTRKIESPTSQPLVNQTPPPSSTQTTNTQLTVSNQSTTPQDETANWKTFLSNGTWKMYKNDSSGALTQLEVVKIQFKYPPNWTVTETEKEGSDKGTRDNFFSALSDACNISLTASGGSDQPIEHPAIFGKAGKIEIDKKTFNINMVYKENTNHLKVISIYSIPNFDYDIELRPKHETRFANGPWGGDSDIPHECVDAFYKIFSSFKFIR